MKTGIKMSIQFINESSARTNNMKKDIHLSGNDKKKVPIIKQGTRVIWIIKDLVLLPCWILLKCTPAQLNFS